MSFSRLAKILDTERERSCKRFDFFFMFYQQYATKLWCIKQRECFLHAINCCSAKCPHVPAFKKINRSQEKKTLRHRKVFVTDSKCWAALTMLSIKVRNIFLILFSTDGGLWLCPYLSYTKPEKLDECDKKCCSYKTKEESWKTTGNDREKLELLLFDSILNITSSLSVFMS